MARRGRRGWLALGGLLLALLYGGLELSGRTPGLGAPSGIEALHAEQRSGVVVEEQGVVAKLLPDDRKGSRHQRFILRLASGHTVLVSHNIDLAPRVADLQQGDRVAFRGQYEWNERGGVVHWTHRDPQGQRPGGWIERAGRRYR